LLVKSMDPSSTRKVKAPKKFQPAQSDISGSVIDDFVDQQRKTTTVSISDVQFGVALDPELFVYRDPFAAGRRQLQP